ncbi:copper homeostasis periplasmic binding protein CopC [Pantoea sp. LMR881]|uniref:copper homeostasis periplasmic binding protein CopC n=1 Tax=Pantoea sp. LMR881 TaxID=3014336 RepID=UPI0022AF66FF|nr:copper homeostasis periplasmic binding protein CopC [Pantoea sp. LMR881]MCZ4058260.1 copper homeostasis periplasmic binding protein CopC [Pantoea sp. LMR881]
MQKTLISGAVISLVFAGAFFSPFASAHAHLRSSEPAAKADVMQPQTSLTLTFTEDVEAAFSGVEIVDAQQKTVASDKAILDSKQHSKLIVNLAQPLATGSYQVNWHVLSVDGHKTKGSYRFNVK